MLNIRAEINKIESKIINQLLEKYMSRVLDFIIIFLLA